MKQKMKYSFLHYNVGTNVVHIEPENTLGNGVISQIVGEIDKDIQYGIIWANGDFDFEWHRNLLVIENDFATIAISE